MKPIVGYLTWKDFLEELMALRPPVVRVQTYHHRVPRSNPSLIGFWVDAGFFADGQVHIARFHLGSEFEFNLKNNPDWREYFSSLMKEAEDVLRKALLRHGVEVRHGMFAVVNRAQILTSPDGLWRLEKDGDVYRLVPELLEQEAG